MKTLSIWLLILLVCNPLLYAGTAYNTRQSGNWNLTSTWTTGACGGAAAAAVPVAGDTVTICASHAISVTDSEAVGASGASGTIAITHHAGGTLSVNGGGVLDVFGDIDLTQGTINVGTSGSGTIILDTPNTVTSPGYRIITRFGSGQPTDFNCGNGSWTTPGIIQSGGAGPHGFLDLGFSTLAGMPSVNIQKCKFLNLGDTTQHIGIKRVNCGHRNTGGNGSCLDTIINGMLLVGSAASSFTYASSFDGKENFPVSDVHVRASIETDAGGNHEIFYLGDDAPLVSPGVRTLQSSTFYNNTRNDNKIRLDVQNLSDGVSGGPWSCTTPGIRRYNVSVASTAGAKNNAFACDWFVGDQTMTNGSSGGTTTTLSADSNSSMTNEISMALIDNQHYLQSTSSIGAGPNVYQNFYADGGLYEVFDTPDFFSDTGTHYILNNILINKAGTLEDDLNGVQGPTYVISNTVHGSYGVDLAEGTSGAYKLAALKNNIFDRPGAEKCWGLLFANVGNGVRQANANIIKNNEFWGFPNSGDSGATAGCSAVPPNNLVHPGLGAVSYVAFPITQIVTGCTAAAGTNTTSAVTSTGCNASAAQVGDFVKITSNGNGNQNHYGRITAITTASPLSATITSTGSGGAITTFTTGDTFEVDRSFFTSGAYGDSGLGDDDTHADPGFVNPSADFCNWAVSVSIAGVQCATEGKFTLTTGTTTTSLVVAGQNFSGLGVTTNDYVLVVASNGFTERGRSQITSVGTTTLGVNTITGAASGDTLVFITPTQSIAREMVKEGGWDYLGNSATANTAVSETAVLTYIKNAFTPTNNTAKRFGAVVPSTTQTSVVGAVKLGGGTTIK